MLNILNPLIHLRINRAFDINIIGINRSIRIIIIFVFRKNLIILLKIIIINLMNIRLWILIIFNLQFSSSILKLKSCYSFSYRWRIVIYAIPTIFYLWNFPKLNIFFSRSAYNILANFFKNLPNIFLIFFSYLIFIFSNDVSIYFRLNLNYISFF